MTQLSNSIALRNRIIGTLMRDARQKSGRSILECAQAMEVSEEKYLSYELGEQSPSLPELEMLAYFLEVPLSHFWEREVISKEEKKEQPKGLIQLRQRMIGVLLRQARLEASLSLEKLAEKAQLEVSLLEAFELGDEPVPLSYLEFLSGLLNRSIREFQDQHGPVGSWLKQQHALRDFLTLPHEIQVFVSKPINRPYLDLAMRMSEMSVDRLRAVAEGLLEITY